MKILFIRILSKKKISKYLLKFQDLSRFRNTKSKIEKKETMSEIKKFIMIID